MSRMNPSYGMDGTIACWTCVDLFVWFVFVDTCVGRLVNVFANMFVDLACRHACKHACSHVCRHVCRHVSKDILGNVVCHDRSRIPSEFLYVRSCLTCACHGSNSLAWH